MHDPWTRVGQRARRRNKGDQWKDLESVHAEAVGDQEIPIVTELSSALDPHHDTDTEGNATAAAP